ncbi:hypothetical protein Tco_1270266 [Tanacetum coccineum]
MVSLGTAKEGKLYAKFSKCELWLQEVWFFGHVINGDGIKVNYSKIEVVKNWEALRTLTEVRLFIGLAGYTILTQLSRKKRIKPKRIRAINMTLQSSIKDKILAAQKEASNEPAEMQRGLDELIECRSDGTLYYRGRIWVPLKGYMRTLIMDEAHESMYFVYPGAEKMYYDLRDM